MCAVLVPSEVFQGNEADDIGSDGNGNFTAETARENVGAAQLG